jgi:hypothetical protein
MSFSPGGPRMLKTGDSPRYGGEFMVDLATAVF